MNARVVRKARAEEILEAVTLAEETLEEVEEETLEEVEEILEEAEAVTSAEAAEAISDRSL